MNQLGLSTQVPAKWSYISSGPYHEFQIGTIIMKFKHRSNREISGISRQTAAIIQALKAIGEENVAEAHLGIIKRRLPDEEKACMLKEARQAPVWVYGMIKRMCESSGE